MMRLLRPSHIGIFPRSIRFMISLLVLGIIGLIGLISV
jgi:hypothetical protein